jgi:hypothetical protein
MNLHKLTKLLEKNGIRIIWRQQGDSIFLGSREFRPSYSPSELVELSDSAGILLNHSTKEQRIALRDRNINYLDPKGYLHMKLGPSERIIIEEHITKRKSVTKRKNQDTSLSPTLLVSPNGLALIDTILRTSSAQLRKIRSTLQFCKLHDLYQPKASKIMTSLKAKDLLDLKSKLILIPIEWWLFAFDAPATRRKMSAFFDIAQQYYSADSEIEGMSEESLLKNINSKFGNNVAGGPTQVAKKLGVLIDPGISLWVAPAIASQIKKDFKLIAGRKANHKTWLIATPPVDLRKAELLSHLGESNSSINSKSNQMRAIWDLSFSESRLREIRIDLLRSLRDEI